MEGEWNELVGPASKSPTKEKNKSSKLTSLTSIVANLDSLNYKLSSLEANFIGGKLDEQKENKQFESLAQALTILPSVVEETIYDMNLVLDRVNDILFN